MPAGNVGEEATPTALFQRQHFSLDATLFFMLKKCAESVLRCLSCRFLSRTDHALALSLSQPFERTFDSSDEEDIISTARVADVSRSLDAELEITSVCQPRDLEPSARMGVLQEESVIDARYY